MGTGGREVGVGVETGWCRVWDVGWRVEVDGKCGGGFGVIVGIGSGW